MHGWYIFGAWLMHSLMVQFEVQVGACLMHLFMVQVDYNLFGQIIVTGYLYSFDAWLMHLFMVQVEVQVDVWYMLDTGYWYRLLHVDYRLIGTSLQQYISQ
jgi:hypothetical protein